MQSQRQSEGFVVQLKCVYVQSLSSVSRLETYDMYHSAPRQSIARWVKHMSYITAS